MVAINYCTREIKKGARALLGDILTQGRAHQNTKARPVSKRTGRSTGRLCTKKVKHSICVEGDVSCQTPNHGEVRSNPCNRGQDSYRREPARPAESVEHPDAHRLPSARKVKTKFKTKSSTLSPDGVYKVRVVCVSG